mgnify:FL=1
MTEEELVVLEREAHNAHPMEITQEWLDFVTGDRGLTKGQVKLLNLHTGGEPYVGKEITNQVANFIFHCRGYRGLPDNVKAYLGW